jgi:hypothetical protein
MMTHAFHTTAVADSGGRIVLPSTPIAAGRTVDVIVVVKTDSDLMSDRKVSRYPLRGTAYHFDLPYEPPILPGEWNAGI